MLFVEPHGLLTTVFTLMLTLLGAAPDPSHILSSPPLMLIPHQYVEE